MPITPSSATIELNQTLQLTATGITNPVWTVDGLGSITQSGLFTPAAPGTAIIRAHTSAWDYVSASFFTKNPDDTLTKNTSNPGYFHVARSSAILNNVGDSVIFKVTRNSQYWTGVENDSNTHRCVLGTFSGGGIREYHPSTASPVVTNLDPAIVGDVIKIEIISGGFLQFSKNNSVYYTSTYSFLNQNLRFITDADLPNGTVVPCPYFNASNFTELQAAVNVSNPEISTTNTSLSPNQTQQFYVTGIATPIWLSNGGTINQSGLFTAPNLSGAIEIKASKTIYSSYNQTHLTKNPDESLTVNSAQASSPQLFPKLNLPGDFLEVTWWGNDDPNIWLIQGDLYWIIGADGRWAFQSSPYEVVNLSPYINPGSKVKLQLAAGNMLQVWVDNVLRHTYSNRYTFGVPISCSLTINANTPAATIIQRPRVGGPGVTNFSEAAASVLVTPPLLSPREGLELYVQSSALGLANNAAVASCFDLSGNGRNLTAIGAPPKYKTADERIQWESGSDGVLKTDSIVPVSCGWILAKYDGASFSGFHGLLTDTANIGILVGSEWNPPKFFNFGHQGYEFRSNDLIQPASDADGPFNQWKLIFFRFWQPVSMQGIHLGKDRNQPPGREWRGGVKFLALYSRNFCEKEIRDITKAIAANYGMQANLADVFPFQSDKEEELIVNKRVLRSGSDEFGKVVRIKRGAKKKFRLQFSNRSQSEVEEAEAFWRAHHPEQSFLIRDYSYIPPRDCEVISTNDELNIKPQNVNRFSYSIDLREK